MRAVGAAPAERAIGVACACVRVPDALHAHAVGRLSPLRRFPRVSAGGIRTHLIELDRPDEFPRTSGRIGTGRESGLMRCCGARRWSGVRWRQQRAGGMRRCVLTAGMEAGKAPPLLELEFSIIDHLSWWEPGRGGVGLTTLLRLVVRHGGMWPPAPGRVLENVPCQSDRPPVVVAGSPTLRSPSLEGEEPVPLRMVGGPGQRW